MGEPVIVVVSLPVGEVAELSTLQITDTSGNRIPAQFRDLSRCWWGRR